MDPYEDTTRKPTKVEMTPQNRLNILVRAREILSDKENWTTGLLRRRSTGQYCLLGACEQAVYDLGLAKQQADAFEGYEDSFDAFALGRDLSLYTYAQEKYGASPDSVNDRQGYEPTMKLLDEYIEIVRAET